MVDYKLKYLKYKNKYLDLKNGGSFTDPCRNIRDSKKHNCCTKYNKDCSDSNECKLNNIKLKCCYEKISNSKLDEGECVNNAMPKKSSNKQVIQQKTQSSGLLGWNFYGF
jgi:hypothetical protein